LFSASRALSNDRYPVRWALAQAFEDHEAVPSWQAEVEDDEIARSF
jgi:hypothetical protein